MSFEIEFTEIAEEDLDRIKAFHRRLLLSAIELHLRHQPTRISRARIKRLRLLDSPAFRLRVDDYRVFYDVDQAVNTVTILRILDKAAAIMYLEEVSGHEESDP